MNETGLQHATTEVSRSAAVTLDSPALHHAVDYTLDHSSVSGCCRVPHNQGAGRLLVPLDGRPVAGGKAPDGQQLQQHHIMAVAMYQLLSEPLGDMHSNIAAHWSAGTDGDQPSN
jgi:hypothetical protein